jgi:hypothetical protein
MATGFTTKAKRGLCLVDVAYPYAGERPNPQPQALRRHTPCALAEVRRA